MKPADRSEVLDYVTYGEQRDRIRAAALRAKSVRRILVGEYFTFLFENRETVLYQIQEMMRIERIVKEDDIAHEIDTYNELIHPRGTIGCTLMVGIDDEAARDLNLRAWLGMNEHIYARLPNGDLVRPSWDPRQVGDDRLSSVQYLSFGIGEEAPAAIGIGMPGIDAETELSGPQREALREDLTAD
ncbi:MAG: DUF3501 family protein [Polyangiales bacterium]